MKDKPVILFEDESSARFVENIKGWVDINNRFFGNNPDSERMARYSSCTHQRCECGEIMERGWTKCKNCRTKAEIDKYYTFKFEEWDGKECVYSELANRYFRDADEIEDYLADEEIEAKDLRLLICVPNHFNQVAEDYWSDVLPDDGDGELPPKMQTALNDLNEIIKTLSPASYSPSNTRTEYRSV